MIRLTFVAMALVLVGPAGRAVADQVFEGWDQGTTDGWEPNTSTTEIEVIGQGGVGNSGYLHSFAIEGGPVVGAFQKNEPYVGDFGAHGYRHVEVAIQFLGGSFVDALFRVRYLNFVFNGWHHSLTGDFTPGIWRPTYVDFDPYWSDNEAMAAGWVQEQFAPSFAETMAHVYTTEIRLSGSGELSVGLDEFRLGETPVPAQGGSWGRVKSVFFRR